MSDIITGIDHALIGVLDLEAAKAVWTRLGFTVTPRGRHVGWGTANYCLMFERDYIELLGIVDPSQFVNRLDEALSQHGEGLLGLALATPNAQAAHLALGRRAPTEAPSILGRVLELPEGKIDLKFQIVKFKEGGLPKVPAFLCHHLTAPALRRPEWLTHANGVVAVEGISVLVDDPDQHLPAYQALFGSPALRTGDGRLDITIGNYTIRLLSRVRLARRYPGLPVADSRQRLQVLTLRTRALLETRTYLTGQGLRPVPVQGARLVLPPELANGVILEFV